MKKPDGPRRTGTKRKTRDSIGRRFYEVDQRRVLARRRPARGGVHVVDDRLQVDVLLPFPGRVVPQPVDRRRRPFPVPAQRFDQVVLLLLHRHQPVAGDGQTFPERARLAGRRLLQRVPHAAHYGRQVPLVRRRSAGPAGPEPLVRGKQLSGYRGQAVVVRGPPVPHRQVGRAHRPGRAVRFRGVGRGPHAERLAHQPGRLRDRVGRKQIEITNKNTRLFCE